jgi:TMEM175 potassium channel family protein
MNNSEQNALSFERIVFFSDAVFAIAITLLVLEIKVPHLDTPNETELRAKLWYLLPKIVGFIVSFFVISLMWFEHHRIFRYIKNFDGGLIWRNLVFLLTISFIPFPTALSSENSWSRTAFMIYALSFAFAGLAKFWIWSYASSRRELLAENVDSAFALKIKRRSLAVPFGAITAALLSLISIFVAPIGFAFIPLYAYLLDPTRRAAEIETVEAAE